jgi:carbonic anhydrase
MPLKLLKGIRHFKNNAFIENKNLFSMLTEGQNPDILFITCSDSRIIPSSITHAEYGDLFCIRNAGNIIPPYTSGPSGEAATIEYALKKLHIKEIIVCGHSQCGAMQGLLDLPSEMQLPAVESWLNHAKPALDKVEENHPELEEGAPSKLIHTTQENILLQIENLKTHPAVKEKLENKELLLHGWFYDIKSGEIFIYTPASNAFIPFEEAVTEFFNSSLVYTKMQSIIEEEALNYLRTLSDPQTAALYCQLKEDLNQVALKGVGPIWESIENAVKLRLWSEFGELCEKAKGYNDPRFIKLLQLAQEVKTISVKSLHGIIIKSHGFMQFCSQTLRATREGSEASNDSECLLNCSV